MERTPSPPRRLHTPPAPLYGDSYEPFSPRRSSRVAAQHGLHHEQTTPRPRVRRDVTPTASAKRSLARPSNFTLSPPSSPSSPHHLRSPRSTRRAPHDFNTLDSDSDHVAPTPARRLLSTMASGMLPTPAKTPRKRRIEDMSSTARVLFPSRPATIDEVVPTPRKSRKTKDLYTLESFARHEDDVSENIPIYTDSKERVPTPGRDEDDNPFLTKKGKGKARATAQKAKKVDAKTDKMNAAASRDEGMVYIFRGKKVFRKFHDGPSSDVSQELELDADLSADDLQIKRQIGYEARRPLTRSSIKPRLLFQAEIEQRNRENGQDDDDEEAVTDIEVPVATPSRRKGKAPVVHRETTPPPTVRKVRKQISFDSWTRVKSSHSSASSTRETKKRSGEALERPEADKRARTRLS
ncbi:hypothetical protein IQ07DRAFT_588247 [Pyrenochaeta sp. DS3sAY3a]|nr:hypothetical protein IQ07DRAFT_588247 [Pyrenochaeta sp. DS3sAY3a]